MADNLQTEEPGTPPALPDPPAAPWATMVTTLLILFVFGALVVAVLRYGEGLDARPSAPPADEHQLQELRAAEREILDNYGHDPQTQTYRIPVERAMGVLIDEAKPKGEMQSFPAKPKAKK